MIPDRQDDGRILRAVGQDRITKGDARIGEVHFQFVAQATRNGPLRTQADPAGAGVEAEVARDDRFVGVANVADVILETATWLERPAGCLVLNEWGALPRRSDLGHRTLDLGERFLERFDLGLEQLDLGLRVVDRVRRGDRGVGSGVGRVGLRLDCLRERGGRHHHGGSGEQRADE